MAPESILDVDSGGDEHQRQGKSSDNRSFAADVACLLEARLVTAQKPATSSFVKHFSSANGPPQVLFICFMLALASGCTVGVVSCANAMDRASSVL